MTTKATPFVSPDAGKAARFGEMIDGMIAQRNAVCDEYALKINHRHTIGCLLVQDYMQKNHANLPYGSQAQWVEESAFCALHERQMILDFFRSKGLQV